MFCNIIPKNDTLMNGGGVVRKFSLWSMGMMIAGLILFGLTAGIEKHVEILFLLGSLSFVFGIVFSFVAIAKQEEGWLKFISLCSFFIVFFLISWFEPFHFIRALTWLKNMA